MTDPTATPGVLWHPFTPAGMAGAAAAPRWQLRLALGLIGTLSAVILLYFFFHCWQPVITEAIDRLPEGSLIRDGILLPGGDTTDFALAGNRHLAVALNWSGEGAADQASDLRIVLRIDQALVCSFLGCVSFGYEALGNVPVGRTETGAWWRAWSPYLYAAAAVGHFLYLIICWWVLTIVHAWVIRLFAFYLDRAVDFAGAARVAQAALMPGALWLIVAVFFHAQGWLNLPGLLVVFVMHVPVGWLYAGLACRHLPFRPDKIPANPFHPPDAPAEAKVENPFRGKGD